MVSRGIGINLNLLEINLVNTLILDVGLFYVLGDVLGGLLNDRLRVLLSELFQRKEKYLTSFYKLVRAGKVVSFSCVESWRIVYGESVMRMAAKTKILATLQLLEEFKPHVKNGLSDIKTFHEFCTRMFKRRRDYQGRLLSYGVGSRGGKRCNRIRPAEPVYVWRTIY
jgi:hypothetical protein